MNIKNILLVCGILLTSLHGTEETPLKSTPRTVKWFEWAIKQFPYDIFSNHEANYDIDERINSLERYIDELEKELEQGSVTIEELNDIATLYANNATLSGLGACIMFVCKENLYTPHASLVKKAGLYGLFLTFITNGIQYTSKYCDILQQKQGYSAKLRAKLDDSKQLLATLKSLRANRPIVVTLHLVPSISSENLHKEII
ncbi:MAG: DUF3375 domain-containing protein [Candidatus Dependentiae bacterium]|nr:DUF3375 domain-containing protein [Candidatus Dependentiae bacterium]